MNDEQLIEALRSLGIDEQSWRAIALLPLLQVAWADGDIQKAERDLIVKIAGHYGLTPGDGARLLHGWLRERPTDAYFAIARKVLYTLVERKRMGGEHDRLESLGDLLHMCEVVAEAAGGLFGLAFTVHPREREAIREIAEALCIDLNDSWSRLTR